MEIKYSRINVVTDCFCFFLNHERGVQPSEEEMCVNRVVDVTGYIPKIHR